MTRAVLRRHGGVSSWADCDFATAGNPNATQTGLHVTFSPESGSGGIAGARMSFVSLDDCGSTARSDPNGPDPAASECDGTTPGLQVNFQDWDHVNHVFVVQHAATGLSRFVSHTVRMRMWFFEGVDNDVVETCVDTTQCVAGRSWEDFYRDGGNGPVQPTSRVDRLLVRMHNPNDGDVAHLDHAGNGVFIDNVTLASHNYTGAAFSVSGPSSQLEGNLGTTNATYTVTLSEALPFTTQVDWETVNGTATAPSDYTAVPPTTLTFAAGQTTKQVNVAINGDVTDEQLNETFNVKLTNSKSIGWNSGAESFGKYAAIDTAQKQTTILDDDSTLRINDVSQLEGSAALCFATFDRR